MRTNWSSGLACFLGLAFVCPASAATRYVDVSNATPAAPYASWGSAATNIQTAIEESASGDEILVAPGIYYLRGDTIYIPYSKTLTLRSTHSREAIIDAEGLNQGMSIYGTNSLVEGFTIRNGGGVGNVEGGGARIGESSTLRDCLVVGNQAYNGGGVWVHWSSIVEHCTIQSNRAANSGGGAYFSLSPGLIRNCIISDNISSNSGGGVFYNYAGTVSNCRISGNQTLLGYGGGVYVIGYGELANSVVAGNDAGGGRGGGVFSSGMEETNPVSVVNCTIISNTAAEYGGGGGATHSTRWVNDILYHNAAPILPNLFLADPSCTASNCCVTPDFGASNFTNAPAFVDAAGGDYHLATASFCIDSGLASGAPGDDFDGVPRPQVGTPGGAALPDVGAYEYRFHFNDIDFTASNVVDLVWDEQDQGLYALDASVPGLVNPVWLNLTTYTNSGLAPGQFGVHMQTLTILPPVPAHAGFRLRISRSLAPGKRRGR